MAETVDELIAQYRRQKADAALAKASDSGADAELVEAVNQARKATVRAEEEADEARRRAAELGGQLEEMRKDLTAMTGARDSALDDLRRAHLALDALEDGDKDDDGALDAVKAELAAEKQRADGLARELAAEREVSAAARKAAEAFEERCKAAELAAAAEAPAAPPVVVEDQSEALRASREELDQLRRALRASQDDLLASQSTVATLEKLKDKLLREADELRRETRDGSASPLRLEVCEQGANAVVEVADGWRGSPMPLRDRGLREQHRGCDGPGRGQLAPHETHHDGGPRLARADADPSRGRRHVAHAIRGGRPTFSHQGRRVIEADRRAAIATEGEDR